MKKIFNLYVLRILAMILSSIIIIFSVSHEIDTDLGLLIPKEQEWIPLILFGLIFLLYLLEFITIPGWKRIFFFIFAALVFILMGLESMGNLNVAIFMFSCIYLIMLIVALARTSIHLKSLGKEPNPNFGFQKTTNIKGKLSVAYVSKKHRTTAYLLLFLSLLIGSCFFSLFLKVNLYPILSVLLFVLITVILYLLLMVLTNPLRKALKQMNQTAEFGKFEKQLQEFYKDPLHPDTIAYLSAIQANYLFSVDIEKGLKLFEGITKPAFASYLLTYTQIEITYFINSEQWDKAREAIQAAKEKYPKQASFFDTYKRTIQILSTKESIANIEALYPLTTKQKFLNLTNAYLLLMYHHIRDDEQKAKSYAGYILENTTELLEYRKAVDRVLSPKKAEEPAEAESKQLSTPESEIQVPENILDIGQSSMPTDEKQV